jgi:tetratricopeptide (TPR) repeat protein
MFPVVALAYDRAFFARGWREVFRLRGWFHLAAVAIAAWMVYQFRGALLPERAASAGFGVASVTPWEYFRSQAGVLVHYLWLSVWPRTLCLDYRWPVAQAPWDIYAPGVLILTLLGLTAWALWKAPRWGFLGVCFFVILAPTSSIMPIADLAFEHRLYLPLAALTAVVVLAVGGIPDRNVPSMGGDDAKPPIDSPWPSGGTMIRCALLGTVLATLSARTFVRNRDYLDPVRMWNSVLAVSPWNYRAHNQLALQYEQRGRLDEAERHFQETLRHRPDAWWVDIGLGNLRARQNRLEDAERHFRRAAEQNAGVGLAAANLGRLREREKKWAEAVAFYKVAVARNPSHLDVWLAKGQAHEQLQQVEEATAAYRYVLERDPRSMEAKRGLARCHSAVPR